MTVGGSLCGGRGRHLEFNQIGEAKFDELLAGLYTDKARARAIRLLFSYTWGESKLPEKYKKIAEKIDCLGWNDERSYGIECTFKESSNIGCNYRIRKATEEDIKNCFPDITVYLNGRDSNLNDQKIFEGDLELRMLGDLLNGNYNNVFNVYLHMGLKETLLDKEYTNLFNATMLARKLKKDDLAEIIIKGLLTYCEETLYPYDVLHYNECQEVLRKAKQILGKNDFKKSGFAEKLGIYESWEKQIAKIEQNP